MKNSLKFILVTVLTVLTAVMFVGCSNYSEVAGTYEMTSVTGTVSGITVSTSSYEYFTIILDANGNGTVKSKGVGGSAYEAKGKYTYKDGKITMTTSNGFSSVSEEYDYADGVITYTVNNDQMKFTLVLTRVEENKN